MIDLIADSIDDLEDTTQVIDYLKREDGLNSLIYNLTEEDLEVPAIKQTAENILSDYNIPQNIDNMTALKSIIRKTLKSNPNNEKVNQFLESTIKTIFNEIDSKIEGVSEVKRVISSELPPEEFLQWLGEEATSLGIYWSYGSGFAYDADTNHPYRYTFVTNINKEDVDILRTELASLRFNKNEEEIRLKQGVPITLTQVLDSNGNELPLTPEITGKTFYSSETKKEGSRMLHIEKVADLNSKKHYLLKDLENSNIDKKDYDNIIQLCNKADPTENRAVYTQWILKQYLNNNFKGEEDVEKFRDTLNKFTKLKNSKKIDQADLNQYKSYGELAEKVKGILEESGGYTSKREEETTKAEEGIRKIDQDGDIELFVVNTPEAAAKEFRNTEWCVKDPRWFNDYAEQNDNFYYFKKGGKPFILLHERDCRNINDNTPSKEEFKSISKLIIEHEIPVSINIFSDEVITKEDGELFDKTLDLLLEAENIEDIIILFENKVITREDRELFNKVTNRIIDIGNFLELLTHKIITKEDGELFNSLVIKSIEDGYSSSLLNNKVITKKDGELFNELLENSLQKGDVFYLLLNEIITREDKDLYNKAVDILLERNPSALLYYNWITREEGDLFYKAVNKAIEKDYGDTLVNQNIITQEELDNIKNNQGKTQETNEEPETEEQQEQDINKKELLHITTIDKIAGAWGEHYSECDGYLDLLDDFLYNQLLEDCAFSDKTDYNAKIEAMGLFFDIIQNKNLYYNSAKDYLEKCINVLENILKTENFSSWRDPILKRKSTEQFLQDMKDFLKTHKTRSTNLFDKFDEAKEPGCINVNASSEDLELSRGEIGVSLEDYDPSKDKEKSTKNRWREKPNQNTAVKPALTQESDNYKKDKLDKAKYTNFLGRTDQDKPVRVMDFATPGQYVGLDDYFTKHTDTLQDDQQQYDTRNFGRGKMQPKQYSNFLYKSELLHIEQGITKEADLNSKKPYLLKDLENSNVDKKEYENIIQLCNKADPTDNKAVYTQWILRQYINGNFQGEEDVEKFRDTLNKFTKLKNSKKIDQADLNQYKSYGELAEKVKGILEESGGYTSKREEETTKAEEGIRKIDQDGDIELFVVNTPEAAAREFRDTEWCVKDPKWFNDDRYGGTDRNFYYFKKNGKPYLLLHKNDFRDIYDEDPKENDRQQVASLMIKYNLPKQYTLLLNKIITKEDGELFNQAVNNVIEKGYGSTLFNNKIIAREDGDLFNQAVNNVIEKGYGYDLLRDKIITREDGDLFYKILKNEVDGLADGEVKVSNISNIYDALKNKYITKEDDELFDKAVSGVVHRGSYGDELILEEIITKEDGDLFTSVYNKAIEEDYYGMFCYDLLTYTNIANDDPELYNKAMEHVFVNPAFLLMNHRTIKKDNDLYNNLVEAVIEEGNKDTIERLHTYNKISDDVYSRFLKNQEDQQSEEQSQSNNQEQQTQEQPEVEEQQDNINKTQLLHITTIDKIAVEAKDSAGETSITPSVTDNVVDQITQKPTDNVTQGKGGGKSVKGTKRGGTGTRPVKALYTTNLKGIDIIADQFGDGVTRTELPESSLKRFRGQDANEKNDKENKDLKKKMKGKPNKPLHNVPKKDVYAWGNDDLNGGALFFSDLSLPQMGDLSEMN